MAHLKTPSAAEQHADARVTSRGVCMTLSWVVYTYVSPLPLQSDPSKAFSSIGPEHRRIVRGVCEVGGRAPAGLSGLAEAAKTSGTAGTFPGGPEAMLAAAPQGAEQRKNTQKKENIIAC